MGQTRKRHSKEFKAKVAMEAVKGVHTLGELASLHKVHPTQIAQWKRQLVEKAQQLFKRGGEGRRGRGGGTDVPGDRAAQDGG